MKNKKSIYENVLLDVEAINKVAVETALEKLRPQLQESTRKSLSKALTEQIDDEPEFSDDELEDELDSQELGSEEEMPSEEGSEELDLTDEEDNMEEEVAEDEYVGEDDEFEDDDLDTELEEIVRELDSDSDATDLDQSDLTIESDDMESDDVGVESEEEEETDLDLESIIREIEEMGNEEEANEEEAEVVSVPVEEYRELKEAKKALDKIKAKLAETRLVNTKLVMVNRLFEAFALTKTQKNKIIDSMDRARNLRDAKMIYSTLIESFRTVAEMKKSKGKKIVEGKGSKAIVVAPKNVIKENNTNKNNNDDALVSRWQRLAKIK